MYELCRAPCVVGLLATPCFPRHTGVSRCPVRTILAPIPDPLTFAHVVRTPLVSPCRLRTKVLALVPCRGRDQLPPLSSPSASAVAVLSLSAAVGAVLCRGRFGLVGAVVCGCCRGVGGASGGWSGSSVGFSFLSLPSLLFPSPVSSSSPLRPFRSALSPAPLPLSRLARSLVCACRLSVGWLRGLLVVGLCSPPPACLLLLLKLVSSAIPGHSEACMRTMIQYLAG